MPLRYRSSPKNAKKCQEAKSYARLGSYPAAACPIMENIAAAKAALINEQKGEKRGVRPCFFTNRS
jgi:hypothetical protein